MQTRAFNVYFAEQNRKRIQVQFPPQINTIQVRLGKYSGFDICAIVFILHIFWRSNWLPLSRPPPPPPPNTHTRTRAPIMQTQGCAMAELF